MVPTAQGSAAALVAGGTVTGATLKHKASWETGLSLRHFFFYFFNTGDRSSSCSAVWRQNHQTCATHVIALCYFTQLRVTLFTQD